MESNVLVWVGISAWRRSMGHRPLALKNVHYILQKHLFDSYVYLTEHHLDSWIKRDQLDATCFFISLFHAQHVSDVNTSILRSLLLICWVISWFVLLWYDVCWCYGVVWLGWFGVVSGCKLQPAAALYPRERPGTHFTGDWVGPRVGLDGRKISSPPGFDPGPSSPWSVTIPTELPSLQTLKERTEISWFVTFCKQIGDQ